MALCVWWLWLCVWWIWLCVCGGYVCVCVVAMALCVVDMAMCVVAMCVCWVWLCVWWVWLYVWWVWLCVYMQCVGIWCVLNTYTAWVQRHCLADILYTVLVRQFTSLYHLSPTTGQLTVVFYIPSSLPENTGVCVCVGVHQLLHCGFDIRLCACYNVYIPRPCLYMHASKCWQPFTCCNLQLRSVATDGLQVVIREDVT